MIEKNEHLTHVNMGRLRTINKHGGIEPVVVSKHRSNNRYGFWAFIPGGSDVRYSGNTETLAKCGARVGVVSKETPILGDEGRAIPSLMTEIRVKGRQIGANKRHGTMDPVLEIHYVDGRVSECFGVRINGDAYVVQHCEEGRNFVSIFTNGEALPFLT